MSACYIGVMTTYHSVLFGDARDMAAITDESIDLLVTSPPYPMIAMWDTGFADRDPAIAAALQAGRGKEAYELMHLQLDACWRECARVLAPGGIACINIGDTTRTLDERFRLYPNHSRVSHAMTELGLEPLPSILWKKPSNAPNKFMGSGMLAPGAYVTHEHEWILLFRNGRRRRFHKHERSRRRESAYFWEERNIWFSETWDLRGVPQRLNNTACRARSAAFPFEIPFRLITMFSVYGDTVLDPFAGLATTGVAAVAAGRNSVMLETDRSLQVEIRRAFDNAVAIGAQRQRDRLAYQSGLEERRTALQATLPRHHNSRIGLPVMTTQETDLRLLLPNGIEQVATDPPLRYRVDHTELSFTGR